MYFSKVKDCNRFRVKNVNRRMHLIYNLNVNFLDIIACKRKIGDEVEMLFNDFFMRFIYFIKNAL